MAVDKLVDSTKLDACCAAEAAAIIAKGGGTAPLAYDFSNNKGFADAIASIPSGGGGFTPINCLTILHNATVGYRNTIQLWVTFAQVKRIKAKYKILDADNAKNIFLSNNGSNPFYCAYPDRITYENSNVTINSDNTVDGIREFDFSCNASDTKLLWLGPWDASWSRTTAYYYLQFYDADNNLLSDMEPCVMDDGIVAFHDKVNNAFYTIPNNFDAIVAGEAVV